MQSSKRYVNVSSLVLLLALSMVLGYQAFGRPNAQQQAPVVATVDMRRLVDGLEMRQAAEAELEQRRVQLETERDRREKALEELQQRLEETPKGDEETLEQMRDQYNMRLLEYRAWAEAEMQALDVDKSLVFRDIDRTIRDAVASLAQANGYDLVLTDDSNREIAPNPEARMTRENQVVQQMLSRRVLYVGRKVDITNELIARMNNEFNAK